MYRKILGQSVKEKTNKRDLNTKYVVKVFECIRQLTLVC